MAVLRFVGLLVVGSVCCSWDSRMSVSNGGLWLVHVFDGDIVPLPL